MADEKFAFEFEKVSVAFALRWGLGDHLIPKTVFDLVVETAPDCMIDIFYNKEYRRCCVESFYGGSKNLNRILSEETFYKQHLKDYDVVFWVMGAHGIRLEHVNSQRLQEKSSALWELVNTIRKYNPKNVLSQLRNMTASQVLHKNFHYFLSCEGALPIDDSKGNLFLLPEYESEFNKLQLGKYITIYSNIGKTGQPKVKTWPLRHLTEYVALMKKALPQIEIVQCGGGGDVKVENADRHIMGVDLELTKYILANSLLHVGCEGGLIHLATKLGTKCLVLFGPSPSCYVSYPKNINISAEVCHPCMYLLEGGGALNVCMRGFEEPLCMASITPQQVFEETCDYLNRLDLEMSCDYLIQPNFESVYNDLNQLA